MDVSELLAQRRGDIIGMRHVLVHEYFGIDLDIVWRAVSADLSELKLKQKIEAILATTR